MEFTTEKRKLVHETLDVEYTSYLPADSDTVRGDVDDTSFFWQVAIMLVFMWRLTSLISKLS